MQCRSRCKSVKVDYYKQSCSKLLFQCFKLYDFHICIFFQAVEERVREQEAASAERARLEEILSLCAEYERQHRVGTATSDSGGETSQSSPLHTLTQNR